MAEYKNKAQGDDGKWDDVQPVAIVASVLQGGSVELTGDIQEIVPEGAAPNRVLIGNRIGNHPIYLGLAGEDPVAGLCQDIQPGGHIILEPGVLNRLLVLGTEDEIITVYYG